MQYLCIESLKNNYITMAMTMTMTMSKKYIYLDVERKNDTKEEQTNNQIG